MRKLDYPLILARKRPFGSFAVGADARLTATVDGAAWGSNFTLAAWVNAGAAAIAGGNHDVLSLAHSAGDFVGGGANRRNLNIQTANRQVRAITGPDSGAVAIAASDDGTDWAQDVWFHAAATFTGTAPRAALLNGGAKGSDATESTIAQAPDRIHIGYGFISGGGGAFSIGHAAIWKRILADGEIAALAAGARPSEVQAADLVFYAPLERGRAVDLVSGQTLVPTGAGVDLTKTPPVP